MEEVIRIHDEWIEQLGGMPGIWSNDVLMYAYEAQLSPYYVTIFEKAANFGGRITKEHAFVDGNKRTGYSCIRLFLARNGFTLLASFQETYTTFRRLALGTAVPGEMTYEELTDWIAENTEPVIELPNNW